MLTSATINEVPWLLGRGDSMWPLIREGSLIEVRQAQAEEVSPADIVVFCGCRRIVCHMVLFRECRKGQLWFYISGNRILRQDGWIPSYRLLSVVEKIDGKSLVSSKLKLRKLLFFWHLRLQTYVVHHLFNSRPMRLAARWRLQWFRRTPILLPWFVRLSAPWIKSSP